MHRLLTGPLTVERLQVAIADLPTALKGITLTQFSDFHFDGIRLSERMLAAAIDASNALEPDIVVLTGDFVTADPVAIHNLVPWLKALQSRLGIYAVLGNHDICYRRSRPEVTKALTSIGIQVLWNEVVYPFGDGLALVGLADFWSASFNPMPVMTAIDTSIPRLVLSHNPDTAVPLQQWRVDLQLSGHTHGGQVVVPGLGNVSEFLSTTYRYLPPHARRFFPWMKACHRVSKHWEWAQGLHTVGKNRLYVNRGLGTYLPGRLFCPPEVTAITLV